MVLSAFTCGFLGSGPRAHGQAGAPGSGVGTALGGSAENWSTHDVLGLFIESPFPIDSVTDRTKTLAPDVRKGVELWVFAQNEGKDNEVIVQASCTRYNPGVTANMDGAIQAAMRTFANAAGDTNPNFNIQQVKVSGLAGRRCTYPAKIRGQDIRIDVLLFIRGQTMWQVQTIVVDSKAIPLADRLIASVKLP